MNPMIPICPAYESVKFREFHSSCDYGYSTVLYTYAKRADEGDDKGEIRNGDREARGQAAQRSPDRQPPPLGDENGVPAVVAMLAEGVSTERPALDDLDCGKDLERKAHEELSRRAARSAATGACKQVSLSVRVCLCYQG